MTGICDINMNGQIVPLRFGMPAVRWFMERLDQEHITPVSDDSINEIGIPYLLYAGYWNHCIAEDKPPKIKLSDFMEWVEKSLAFDDNNARNEMIKAGECYRDSKLVNKVIDKMTEHAEEIKKKTAEIKLTGMTSNPSVTGNSDAVSSNTEG